MRCERFVSFGETRHDATPRLRSEEPRDLHRHFLHQTPTSDLSFSSFQLLFLFLFLFPFSFLSFVERRVVFWLDIYEFRRRCVTVISLATFFSPDIG